MIIFLLLYETFFKYWKNAGLNRLHGNVTQWYRVNDVEGIVTSYADLMTPEELLGIRKVEGQEGTEKVDITAYIWYNVNIKYRRCFYVE